MKSSRTVDSVNKAVDVSIQVDPGPRSRIGEISIDGNRSVSDQVVLRELPFRTGDWYSIDAVTVARERLQAVDLLSQAVVDVDSAPRADSTLNVRIRRGGASPAHHARRSGLCLRGGRPHRTGAVDPPQLHGVARAA